MSSIFGTAFDALRCRRGSVAILMAAAMVPLTLAAGVGVDVARAYLERQRLMAALDAAGLAAGSTQGTDAEVKARFTAFFNANYGNGGGVGGTVQSLDLAIDGVRNVMTATAHAQIDTTFMKLAGLATLDVSASNEVTRQTTGLELAMVLDNTGSMLSNNNIQAVREAAGELVDILFGANASNPNLKISVVPYVATVNVGDAAPAIVTGTGAAYDPADPAKWKGCVGERDYPDDVRDTPPMPGHMWTRYWWPSDKNDPMPSGSKPDNAWPPINTIFNDSSTCNNSTGPNLACPTPITPLTSSKAPLHSAIDGMQAWCRSGTISHVGLAWGWRTLSPDSPFTEGLPYGTPNWRKAAILMTDGENLIYRKSQSKWKSDYTAFGRLDDKRLGTTSTTTAKTVLDSRLSEVCANMKAAGITLYTVTFTSGIDAATKDIYRQCASDPGRYFDAPSQDALKSAFQAIATELSNLRVSR